MVSGNDLLISACAAVLALLVSVGALLLLKKRPSPARELLKLCFFFYVSLLLLLTLRPFVIYPERFISVNVVPFLSVAGYFRSGDTRDILVLFYGNIAAFVPLGLLLPALWPFFRSFWKCLLAGFLCSLGIELGQLAFSYLGLMTRNADVDDLMLNTAGALAGYGLFAVFRLLLRKSRLARSDKYTV